MQQLWRRRCRSEVAARRGRAAAQGNAAEQVGSAGARCRGTAAVQVGAQGNGGGDARRKGPGGGGVGVWEEGGACVPVLGLGKRWMNEIGCTNRR